MDNLLLDDVEKRKKAVFESMSKKRQQYITKRGYEKWDPFQKPNDPIDIRTDKTKRTSQMLVRDFLQSRTFDKYSNSYGRGVLDMALGIINEDEKCIGMYEFACWYKELLKNELDLDGEKR